MLSRLLGWRQSTNYLIYLWSMYWLYSYFIMIMESYKYGTSFALKQVEHRVCNGAISALQRSLRIFILASNLKYEELGSTQTEDFTRRSFLRAGARNMYRDAGFRHVAYEPHFLQFLEGRVGTRLELMLKKL